METIKLNEEDFSKLISLITANAPTSVDINDEECINEVCIEDQFTINNQVGKLYGNVELIVENKAITLTNWNMVWSPNDKDKFLLV